MNHIYDVRLSRKAVRGLKKVPAHIVIKLMSWVDEVGHRGLTEVRKIPGFHDEPLEGKRLGQRSIRLNKAYRAIYKIDKKNRLRFVEILEVNKHEY